jgi:hypothetical protein
MTAGFFNWQTWIQEEKADCNLAAVSGDCCLPARSISWVVISQGHNRSYQLHSQQRRVNGLACWTVMSNESRHPWPAM